MDLSTDSTGSTPSHSHCSRSAIVDISHRSPEADDNCQVGLRESFLNCNTLIKYVARYMYSLSLLNPAIHKFQPLFVITYLSNG